MTIITPEIFYTDIKNQHLLLDTSFFIDASIHQREFRKFVNKLKKNGNILVTIEPVRSEFLLGSDNKSRINKKNQLINSIIDMILPMTPDVIDKYLYDVVKQYGVKGKGVSMGDLLIASTFKRYSRDLLLVTKNPKDFPKPIAQLKTYFLMDLDRGLQIYAVLAK